MTESAERAAPTERPRSAFRGASVVAMIAAIVALATGCIGGAIGAPPGDGPMRYRDPVFTGVSVTRDLTYGSPPDLGGNPVALKLDLYQPTGDTAATRPAIVWAHAGGFSGGDKNQDGYLAEPLVRRGFVVVAINYRLLAPPEGCSGANAVGACQVAAGAAINDGQAAVRWLRANAATHRIDPNRIGFSGFSAGGVMATGVGLLSDLPGSSGNPGYSSRVGGWVSVAGGLPGGLGASPGDPAGYLFTGTADTTVPHQWSLDTAHALDAAGGAVILRVLPGHGHDLPDLDELAQQSANFYWYVLDLAHASA